MFFNILATFAEFEVDLLRARTREGMAVARANGKLRGRGPKLSPRQQVELRRLHADVQHSIADLAEVFAIGRATVYRTLRRPAERDTAAARAGSPQITAATPTLGTPSPSSKGM